MKEVVKEYYKQLYTNKFNNQHKIAKLLERCKLPKLNKEEIENLSRPITSKQVKLLIKKLPRKQNPEPEGFTCKFYQISKAELTPTLPKLLQKIEEERTLSNSFYEVSIIHIVKPKTS